MTEKFNLKSKTAAATAAGALAIAGGLAGHAKAENSPSSGIGTAVTHSGTNPERHPGRLSIEHATAQAAKAIIDGKPINSYRGTVDIVDIKTGQTKVKIVNPVVVYRNGASNQEHDIAMTHPRSKFWAVGYIKYGVEGNLGHSKLMLLPYNSGGNNFVFHKEAASKVQPTNPALEVVEYTSFKDGTPNLDVPLSTDGEPLTDKYGHTLPIGQLIGPDGSLPTPEV